MNLPNYQLGTNSTHTVFKFVSIGPRGHIPKAVVFSAFDKNLYNLALGDINPKTDFIDDMSRSDNGDMEKILSTVAECIYKFTENYPESDIFIEGNSDSRNRLYRSAFNKFLSDIEQDFQVFGVKEEALIAFDKNTQINYDAFIIKKKKP